MIRRAVLPQVLKCAAVRAGCTTYEELITTFARTYGLPKTTEYRARGVCITTHHTGALSTVTPYIHCKVGTPAHVRYNICMRVLAQDKRQRLLHLALLVRIKLSASRLLPSCSLDGSIGAPLPLQYWRSQPRPPQVIYNGPPGDPQAPYNRR